MESLHLFGNQLTDDGVVPLGRILNGHKSNLCILDIGKNGITTEGVKRLSRILRMNRKLKELWLHENQIGDDGVKALVDVLVEDNNTLEELYLHDNQAITDASVQSILRLQDSTLKRMSIFGCSLSIEGIERLKNEQGLNSRLKIYYETWSD